MWRYLAIGGFLCVSALQAPQILGMYQETRGQAEANYEQQQLAARTDESARKRNPLAGRVEEIEATRSGHFVTKARINGRSVQVLVDTGATMVSMNEHLARRVGITLKDSDYKYKSRTANGIKKVALAKVDEIKIGRIVVQDVEVAVSKGKKLDTVLLGMSFLGKLRKFEMASGQLVLTQ